VTCQTLGEAEVFARRDQGNPDLEPDRQGPQDRAVAGRPAQGDLVTRLVHPRRGRLRGTEDQARRGARATVASSFTDINAAGDTSRIDVEAVLADPKLNAAVSVWSLHPEQINVYKAGYQEMFERLSAAVRAADPLGRPVYMYLQSNADEHQFEQVATHTHVLGQGNYLATHARAHQRIYLKASIERSFAAIASSSCGR
jgi:hypothetical protein